MSEAGREYIAELGQHVADNSSFAHKELFSGYAVPFWGQQPNELPISIRSDVEPPSEFTVALHTLLKPAFSAVCAIAEVSDYDCRLAAPSNTDGSRLINFLKPQSNRTGRLANFTAELLRPSEMPVGQHNYLTADTERERIVPDTLLPFIVRAAYGSISETACYIAIQARRIKEEQLAPNLKPVAVVGTVRMVRAEAQRRSEKSAQFNRDLADVRQQRNATQQIPGDAGRGKGRR